MWSWMLAELSVGGIALPVLAYMGWMANDDVERLGDGAARLDHDRGDVRGLVELARSADGVGEHDGGIRGGLSGAPATHATGLAHRLDRARRASRRVRRLDLGPPLWPRVPHTALAERFAWGWLAFMTLSAVIFLLWMDRRIRRDVEKFDALKRELL